MAALRGSGQGPCTEVPSSISLSSSRMVTNLSWTGHGLRALQAFRQAAALYTSVPVNGRHYLAQGDLAQLGLVHLKPPVARPARRDDARAGQLLEYFAVNATGESMALAMSFEAYRLPAVA